MMKFKGRNDDDNYEGRKNAQRTMIANLERFTERRADRHDGNMTRFTGVCNHTSVFPYLSDGNNNCLINMQQCLLESLDSVQRMQVAQAAENNQTVWAHIHSARLLATGNLTGRLMTIVSNNETLCNSTTIQEATHPGAPQDVKRILALIPPTEHVVHNSEIQNTGHVGSEAADLLTTYSELDLGESISRMRWMTIDGKPKTMAEVNMHNATLKNPDLVGSMENLMRCASENSDLPVLCEYQTGTFENGGIDDLLAVAQRNCEGDDMVLQTTMSRQGNTLKWVFPGPVMLRAIATVQTRLEAARQAGYVQITSAKGGDPEPKYADLSVLPADSGHDVESPEGLVHASMALHYEMFVPKS